MKIMSNLEIEIPLSFAEKIERYFESVKRFVLTQSTLSEIHPFLNKSEFKSISTNNPLLIKWLFLTDDVAYRFDILKCELDHAIRSTLDFEFDETLSEYDSRMILAEGRQYFDLSEYEVSLLRAEIIDGDLSFFILRKNLEVQLEYYQQQKKYKNLSSLASAYLDLRKTKPVWSLFATINPEVDLTPLELPDYLILQVRLLKESNPEDQIEISKIISLLTSFETNEDKVNSFGVTDPYDYMIAWISLIEHFVSREDTASWRDEQKKRHDQMLLKLIPQSDNPGSLLRKHHMFYLPAQYQAERVLLNLNFPGKLDYFLNSSAFFQITAPPVCCENGRCDLRDLILNRLRTEFPEHRERIEFRYFVIMWRHVADDKVFKKPAALKTVEILDKRYRQSGKLRMTKEAGSNDGKYLRWLLKSWIYLEQNDQISELVLFVFDNADKTQICSGAMLEILLCEERYEMTIQLGQKCLVKIGSEKSISAILKKTVERIIIAMAWAFTFIKEPNQIETLRAYYEKECYGLSVEDDHYEELKRIQTDEENYIFYFDEDAYIG